MKVLAGVVLYNPDINRLGQNILAIYSQVDCVICVDNGSVNLDQVKALLPSDIIYIENKHNLGIAAALNQIMKFADCYNFDWFITLDQDSVCKSGLVSAYRTFISLPSVALLTCRIIDRNFTVINKQDDLTEPFEIKECITSASFCNTKAFKCVGGFDERMFIDSVDFDICLNLRKHGFKIYRIPFIGLLHEVGHGRNVNVLWKRRVIYNHSIIRNYYIARNHYYMAYKWPKDISLFKTRIKEIETIVLILLYETDKFKKIHARRRGVKDAKNNHMGECIWY